MQRARKSVMFNILNIVLVWSYHVINSPDKHFDFDKNEDLFSPYRQEIYVFENTKVDVSITYKCQSELRFCPL